jgi:hypothetical protein
LAVEAVWVTMLIECSLAGLGRTSVALQPEQQKEHRPPEG